MSDRRLVSRAASAMTMRAPKWLYDLRMPAGAITLLAGREGIGKSTISYDVASRLTSGTLPGKYYGRPTDVAVVATEDTWEEVIVPRLVAAGADLDRVHQVEARDEEGHLETISVPADLEALADLTTQLGIVLLLLDPVMSVIHAGLDTHKDREVRRALDPLVRFGSQTGVSTLGLIHVNKSNGTDPVNLIMGSRAFSAVARSVLYCMADPESEKEDRYLLGHVKSNLGPKQPTLVYGIEQVKIQLDDAEESLVLTSRVRWDGVDDRTIRDAMETPRPERPAGELSNRLLDWVAAQGRTVATAEIAEEFSDQKRGTLDKALARLVDRGKLTRPVFGHYAAPGSGTQSGTPSALSSVPEMTEVPDDLASLADLADMALPDAPEVVPEPGCQKWDTERMVLDPGRTRRRRERVVIEYRSTGFLREWGGQQETCQAIFADKAPGFRDRYHAFHETRPTVWIVSRYQHRSRYSSNYCDDHFPDEYRSLITETQ